MRSRQDAIRRPRLTELLRLSEHSLIKLSGTISYLKLLQRVIMFLHLANVWTSPSPLPRWQTKEVVTSKSLVQKHCFVIEKHLIPGN